MPTMFTSFLILLILLQVKHLFADFYLQTARMLEDRGRYLHVGRMQHAGVHAGGSVIALGLVGTSWPLVLGLVLIEWLVHFHIDWCKGCWSDRTGDTPADAGYWRAFGVDQTLHQLTYVAMACAWAMLS